MAITSEGVIEAGKPIGGEVFDFFGIAPKADGRYYWSDIPSSPSINPKSRNLPMEFLSDTVVNTNGVIFGRKTQLNDTQRKSRNYGHNFKEYTNALEAIRDVAAGLNFVYERPSAWFRIADLWGYNHSATNWYNFYTSITNISQGSTQPIKMEGDIREVFSLDALSGYTPTNVNFGYLCWNAAFSETQPQVYFLSLTSLTKQDDIFDNLLTSEGLVLSTEKMPVGTWRMYPVLTTNNTFARHSFTEIRSENDYTGKWWPYPYADTLIITVVGQGQGDDNVVQNISVDEPTYQLFEVDSANMVYRLEGLAVTINNEGSTSYQVSYELSFPNALNISNVDGFPLDGTLTIAAGGSSTISYVKDKEPETALRIQVAETPVILQVKYTITVNNTPQTDSVTFELIAGK